MIGGPDAHKSTGEERDKGKLSNEYRRSGGKRELKIVVWAKHKEHLYWR